MARQLWKDGYQVVMASRGLFEESGEPEFIKMVEQTPEMTYIMGDVSVAADRERIVAKTMKLHSRIDVLCNNAGITPELGPTFWA